jgi:hypothetical protein
MEWGEEMEGAPMIHPTDTTTLLHAGTALEVLHPVLFNTFKHHAGALRARIADTVARGTPALLDVSSRLAVVGTRLMDLYTGALSPRELSAWALGELRGVGRLGLDAYRSWLLQGEQYTMLTHPADASRWVLRLGEETGRYVHLHPGRWSPATIRVRANALKTAFLVLCKTGIDGGDPMGRAVINEVRRDLLGLSPVGGDPEGELGLGAVIELLRGTNEPRAK